jgi:hypothetical protein
MQRISLEFDAFDGIAEIVSNSTPPDGVMVEEPANIIKASADHGGGVFTSIAIQLVKDIHDIGILVLATWLYDCCVKSGKKKSRINNQQIVLNKRNIRLLVKRELANQIGCEKKRCGHKHRSPKKRP